MELLSQLSPRIQRDLPSIHTDSRYRRLLARVVSNGSVFIGGGVGSGKTLYAASLAVDSVMYYYIHKQGPKKFIFKTVPTLLGQIRATYDSTRTLSTSQVIGEYSTTDLLVLDDLGVEKSSEWVLQTLYIIINERYENLVPTIFTSNLSGNQLADKFEDDRIPSRIQGMCESINLGTTDYRNQ